MGGCKQWANAVFWISIECFLIVNYYFNYVRLLCWKWLWYGTSKVIWDLWYLSGICSQNRNSHLWWTAGWIHQVLASHLYGLVRSGKLDGIHQPLVAWLTMGVGHTYKIRGLQGEQQRRQQKCTLSHRFASRQILYCPPGSYLFLQTIMNRYIEPHCTHGEHQGSFLRRDEQEEQKICQSVTFSRQRNWMQHGCGGAGSL